MKRKLYVHRGSLFTLLLSTYLLMHAGFKVMGNIHYLNANITVVNISIINTLMVITSLEILPRIIPCTIQSRIQLSQYNTVLVKQKMVYAQNQDITIANVKTKTR